MSANADASLVLSPGWYARVLPKRLPDAFFLFCLYVLTLILLPGGSILGFNFKILLFAPAVLLAWKADLATPGALQRTSIGLLVLAFFLGWIVLAQEYGYTDLKLSFRQYTDVALTLAGCWLIRIFTTEPAQKLAFVRFCIYAVAFGSLLKLAILLYALRAGVSVSGILDSVSQAFGVQLMTLDVGDVGIRIQYPSDTLVPLCLFAVLCLRRGLKIGGLVSSLLVLLLLTSSVLTFSRFLWAFTAAAALLGILVARRDRLHLLYLVALATVLAAYADVIVTLVQLRFSALVVGASDGERISQKDVLLEFFRDAPLLGHGLGTYPTMVIRAPELPYNYEMQLVALAGQVGLLGLIVLSVLLTVYFWRAFRQSNAAPAYKVAVLALLLLFLSSGLVNPYLVSSIASASFGLLFVLAGIGEFRNGTYAAAR